MSQLYTYSTTRFGMILRQEDGAEIPNDDKNSDYQQYLAWVALGNVATLYTPSTEDIAEESEKTKLASDSAGARQYTKLQALANMTPAEVQAWVTANVNNLADAKDALMTLAIAVSILARRI